MSVHLERAGVLLQQGRYDLLEREAAEALEENPENTLGLAYLALASMYRFDGYRALAAARKAVALDPDWAYGHYVHATVLLDQDRLGDARCAIAEALKLAPCEADYYAQQALIDLARDRPLAAAGSAADGLARDPGHVGCANARALALLRQDRPQEAAAAIEHALSLDANNALAFSLRGFVGLRGGRAREAAQQFRQALRIDPRDRIARHGLIEALRSRTVARRVLTTSSRQVDRLFQEHPLSVLLAATLFFAAARKVAESGDQLTWTLVALLYGAVFFSRAAGSLFRVIFLFDRAEKVLLSEEERRAAGCFLAFAALGIVFFGWGLVTQNLALKAAAFACLVLAGTTDHLEPQECCGLGWVPDAVAQTLRIAGMAGLLLGFYLPAAGVLIAGVALHHCLQERQAGLRKRVRPARA